MRRRRLLSFAPVILPLLVGTLLTTGCGLDVQKKKAKKSKKTVQKVDPEQEKQKEAVQQAGEKFLQAMADNDWKTVYESLTTESRKLLLGTLAIGAYQEAEKSVDADVKATLADVLDAHRIPISRFEEIPRTTDVAVAAPIAKEIGVLPLDGAKAFEDIANWYLTLESDSTAIPQFFTTKAPANTTLEKVFITGTVGQGELVTRGDPTAIGADDDEEIDRADIVFRLNQIDNTWYVDLEATDDRELKTKSSAAGL